MATPTEDHPTEAYVAANIRRLRERRGMPNRELAERLMAVGSSLSASGVAKIESGRRRVTVGDLVALALALQVNVNALLLPAEESMRPVHLTPTFTTRWERAWQWANGELPLDVRNRSHPRLSELAEWFELTRPHKSPDEITVEVTAAQQARAVRMTGFLDELDADVGKAQERWRQEQWDTDGEH